MTSKKSFFNLIGICLRNNIWSIALTCIGLFFAMPVYAALYISGLKNRLAMGVYKPEIIPALYRRGVLGEGNIILVIAVCILAIVTAIGGFSYLFSKQKVDLLHSLPKRRGELFAANFLAGIMGFIVPYIAFMVLTLIIGQACGTLDALGVAAAFITLLINILGFIGVYSFTVLAVMLTGNALVSILATMVFLFYGPAIVALFRILQSRFFVTYSGYYADSASMVYSSIVVAYVNLTEGMNGLHGVYDLSLKNFVIYIIITALVIAVDYYMYSIRPSEAAGHAISFKKTMPVISVALLAPAAIFGALAFEGIADGGGRIQYGWIVFGSIIVLAIGHFVLQAIYFSDFKSLFKNLVNPGIASVIVMFVFVTFACDITGFDDYIPKDSQIEYISVSSGTFQSGLEYYNFENDPDEYGNNNYWVGTTEYRFDNMKITDTNLIKDLAAIGIKESREYMEKNYRQNEAANDGTELNLFDNTSYADVQVSYTLKNGKKKCRSYNIDLCNNMDLYDRLYSSKEYKDGVFDILTVNEDDYSNIKVSSPVGTMPQKLTKDQMIELVNTYRSELYQQGAYDLKDSTPVGYLYEDKVIKENGYPCTYMIYKGYIYPSFTKTLNLLNKYGIDFDRYMSVENVESITVRNYNQYSETYADTYNYDGPTAKIAYEGDNSGSEEKVYKTPEEIAKIYECIVPMEMSDVDYIVHKNESIDVEVTFKEMPGNNKYAVSYTFPKGQMPEFVKTDVNYQ